MELHKYINIDRTLSELNIDITKLKPNSEKLVYKICECCKKEELKKYRYIAVFKQTKCLDCSNKINANANKEIRNEKIKQKWKEIGHPRLGISHTDEAKRKMSQNRTPHILSEEEKQNISKRTKGEKNPFYGKTHDDETRKRMSELAKGRVKRGKDSNFYGRTFYAKSIPYIKTDGSIVKLKSGWEEKLALWLDKNKIEWRYEERAFPVSYEFEGKIKDGTYIPDFFVGDEIWEVKGYFRNDAEIKFKTFLKNYPTLKVKLLMRDDLRAMGIKL